ncbi:MAG: patatin-like phospholipase family protein [Prevotellamassilia sp.]
MNKRNVALVLSSGGARGYAHIGAIQALEEHQFQITSVAGTSMGALVGGMYCAGRLDAVKERMCSLTRREVLTLIDWSLGKNHLMKGTK